MFEYNSLEKLYVFYQPKDDKTLEGNYRGNTIEGKSFLIINAIVIRSE